MRTEHKKAVYRRWADNNREHLLAKEAKRRLDKRALCLIATARTRTRKRGLEFDLQLYAADIQARIDRGVCELTGEPFDLSPGRKYNSPSLDRKDPQLGYVHSNIRIVFNLVNAALGDWGDNILASVMRRWLLKQC